ncbi:50S ribosomal protein L6 [Schlesneria paludicola]|uniref:50S ribosomal protein L6 n=1 Tax=Schlesneria paludicola TaxID=360056 RepID=UPI000299FFB6|nr:50S ribosomal protein L6 [Schlesneria paludicola]
MSRIGKKPIPIPQGVNFGFKDGVATVSKGNRTMTLSVDDRIQVTIEDGNTVIVGRADDGRDSRALHGLTRSLLSNMVVGLVTPWEVKLEIVGVGYQAALKSGVLSLQVGFAHSVDLKVPEGVLCELPDNTHISVKSADKHAAGQFAANIRAVRPPEPYKGKGIRYAGERVRRKAGKAFGS